MLSKGHTFSQIQFTILGEPASKANSRQIVRFGSKIAVIKSAKARAYVDTFKSQCPRLSSPLEDDLAVWIIIHYASRRPDLDDSIILDAMQGLVIKNDRQIKERHIYWALDKTNPRSEIWITKVGDPCPIGGSQRR